MADDEPSPQLSPFWWDGVEALPASSLPLPTASDVVVVGSGYTGLACATTIARSGKSVVLLEKDRFGAGASTRSGGQVSGGVTLGKSPSGKYDSAASHRAMARLREASDSMTYLEGLIQDEGLECDYHRTGRLVTAWTERDLEAMASRIDNLNVLTSAEATLLSRDEMAQEVGSHFYLGGMLVRRAGHLQPAKFHAALFKRAVAAGVLCFDHRAVTAIVPLRAGFSVQMPSASIRAGSVVVATNAYTGRVDSYIDRRIIPIASHMIATEPISTDEFDSIIQNDRSVSEHRRVLNYYRKSPDGQRLIFGGRTRFFPITPKQSSALLLKSMTRIFPQLRHLRASHVWNGLVALTFDSVPHIGQHDGIDYCIGCNGSGIALMTYLGHMLGRKLSEGENAPRSAFDHAPMPSRRLYWARGLALPFIGSGMQILDEIDRRKVGLP